MEPNHIIGNVDTLSIEQSQRVPDVGDRIYLLEPMDTPITAFLTQKGKVGDGKGNFKGKGMLKLPTFNPEFTEFEDKYSGIWAQIDNGGGYNSGDTDFVVKNPGASIFTKGDVVKNVRSGEIFYVTGVNYGTDTITVARGQGGVSATSLLNEDYLMVISPASQEGSSELPSNQTKLVKVTNYTQIFKTYIDGSKTQDATKDYPEEKPGAYREYLRRKNSAKHARDIEMAYIFGEKKETTGPDGKPLRYTGGILEGIEAAGNVQDQLGASLTETEFNAFLRDKAFLHGSQEKFFFCGNIVMAAIESWAGDRLQTRVDDRTYGVMLQKYQTSFGVLNLVLHPFLSNQYSGMGFALDMETVRHRPLNGRDTRLTTNVQEKKDDFWMDEILTESGLSRINFEKNALIKNVDIESEES